MTLVIAEAGENHCGDWGIAKKLIDAAARAKVDYVKFQLYDARAVSEQDPERDWFFRVQLPDNVWKDLADYARAQGVRPLCTPWGVEKAKAIHQVTPDAIKIASFHITDEAVLAYANKHFKTVFLSTGMATLQEAERAVALLDQVEALYLLHCVSEYPLRPENANLRVMETLQDFFGKRVKIGYSDHTLGIQAAVAAAAMGAEVVEKHITLDKSMEGTDHILSADPAELMEMVRQIRLVEKLRGSPVKRLTPQESENQKFMRERFSHAPKTIETFIGGPSR